MDYQIITSLTDTDLYKFNMMQTVFHQFPGAEVEYRFRCRTKGVNLSAYRRIIQEQIEAYCDLRMTAKDIERLSKLRYMKPDFLDFLEIYRPRAKHVAVIDVEGSPGEIDIVVKGPWWSTILFEIPCLSIVNEVYFHHTYDMEERRARGLDMLHAKLDAAEQDPNWSEFQFNDFGTRRRMSKVWHKEVLTILQERCPNQFKGTSNVELADELNVKVMGTMAHEYLQAFQALGPRLRDSQKAALDAWVKEYGGDNGIALTDVISMRAFLNDFNLYYTKLFDGLRHDSGCPFEWAQQALDHYRKMGVDSRNKVLVFSDGLTFPKALELLRFVNKRAVSSFGIGTYLTNDTGVPALNVVMKMVKCNGQDVAKLSDSPGKTMCLNQQYVDYLASVFA